MVQPGCYGHELTIRRFRCVNAVQIRTGNFTAGADAAKVGPADADRLILSTWRNGQMQPRCPAPADNSAIGSQPARVVITCGNVTEKVVSRGQWPVLAISPSPTDNPSTGVNGARMLGPGRNGCVDPIRCVRLAGPVETPTSQHTVGPDPTGVPISRRHRNENAVRRVGLPIVIETPTNKGPIRAHPTRMIPPG